jgi:hypothetical protein
MALVVGGLFGCSDNPPSGSSAYKAGELGNGSFLFACDDSVACDRWTTNNAADFPKQIATGAVFDVRFVENGQQGTITTNDQKYAGVTSQPVAPYVSSGPDGFVTDQPGFGVIMAKDGRGYVIDYATITIVKPDSLVVYDASYKGNNPTAHEALTLKVGDAPSFRTVAQYSLEAVAGSIQVQWTSADPQIVQVQSYSRGVVTLSAKGVGSTKLTAAGAALTKDIPVEVKQ